MPSSNPQNGDAAHVVDLDLEVVQFGRFVLDPQKRLLLDDGTPIALTPKAFDTLTMLVAERHRVVSKEELLERLWPDTSVEEANLSQQIFTLRKLLGDDANLPIFIATAARRGYRFIAQVQPIAPGLVPVVPALQREPSPGPRRWNRGAAPLAVVALVGWAGLTAWLTIGQSADRGAAQFKFSVAPPAGTTLPENGGAPAISPDGRFVAFLARVGAAIGSNQLALRRLDSTEVTLIPHTDNATSPFWSPDSRYLGYIAQAVLYKIDVESMGPPVKIAATKEGWSASWGSRGTILISSSPAGGPLFQVAATGGDPRPATTLSLQRGERAHLFPSFLPDGRRFVYLTHARADTSGVYLGSLEGDEPRRLLTASTVARYVTGHLLYVASDTLVAQPFDATKVEFAGEAKPLVAPVEVSNAGFAPFSVSDTGVLVHGEILPRQSQLRWVDRGGRELSPPTKWARYMDPVVVGDGPKVVVAYHDAISARPNAGSDVFVLDAAVSPRRLTSSPEMDYLPVPSPDGKTVAFSSFRSGGGDLYLMKMDGDHGERLLLSNADRKDPTDWSADGQYLFYENVPAAASSDVWYLRLADRKPTPFLTSRANEWGAKISPNGRWFVYTSDESGRHEIHVRAFPSGEHALRVSHDGARHPFWRGDGAEIYYLADNDTIMAAPFVDGPEAPDVGEATVLFAVRPVRYTSRNAFAVARDGRRFLINERIQRNAPRDLKVIVNWSSPALGTPR